MPLISLRTVPSISVKSAIVSVQACAIAEKAKNFDNQAVEMVNNIKSAIAGAIADVIADTL